MSSAGAIADAVEGVTDSVLRALASDEEPAAPAVRFLLRRYAATGREEIRRALEPALALALDIWPRAPRDDHVGWLALCVDAASVSDDDRVRRALGELAGSVRESWGRERRTAVAAAAVEVSLRATDLDPARIALQPAIDELERIVAGSYRPGEGVSATIGHDDPRGRLPDQSAVASALLTAFERTGRLPYSMLAEELMQFARRSLWHDTAGGFGDGENGRVGFEANCEAASVLVRLAVLHGSDEYRGAAVLAPDADYGRDAERILATLAPAAPGLGQQGAVYGLAAEDFHGRL